MTSHISYEDPASPRSGGDEYRQGRAEAERAYLLGRAVRDRRLALGLSQVELATPGRHDPARPVPPRSRRCHPTIPLLDRISAALDADRIVEIAPHAA